MVLAFTTAAPEYDDEHYIKNKNAKKPNLLPEKQALFDIDRSSYSEETLQNYRISP